MMAEALFTLICRVTTKFSEVAEFSAEDPAIVLAGALCVISPMPAVMD
jgi:hypothetical protein